MDEEATLVERHSQAPGFAVKHSNMSRPLLPCPLLYDSVPRGIVCALSRRVLVDPVHVPGDAEGRAVDRAAVSSYQAEFHKLPFSGRGALSAAELAALARDVSVLSSVRRFERAARALSAAEEVGARPCKRARVAEEAAGAAPPGPPPPPDACAAIRLAPEVRFFTADIPAEFFCRLSWAIMADPVVDREGNTWEEAALAAYVGEHGVSPLTGAPTTLDSIQPNTNLRAIIESWLAANTTPWHEPDGAAYTGQGCIAGAVLQAAMPGEAAGGTEAAGGDDVAAASGSVGGPAAVVTEQRAENAANVPPAVAGPASCKEHSISRAPTGGHSCCWLAPRFTAGPAFNGRWSR
ncbi:hypothetical protein TSOC_005777 [Tetrabaena socialis]|uniref:U-box domain-containing protein n=1 Tax=Tetrabaena socialis TaxID=47790 RepID=A0A2J8A5E7_9CHLO|nr:hypothetical protein TSOC_005777 [Tetrabaena socialis]|eukprot:PNH07744.1 hypothetical protein TSOC_005777 [Tetrabaena socialis]